MKKTFVFLLMFGFMLGLSGMVLADDQTVNAVVSENLVVSLLTDNVDYGSIIPGETSAEQTNTIEVDVTNNVDIQVEIELGEGSNPLFENLFFDVNMDTTYGVSEELGITILSFDIVDQSGTFTEDVMSVLMVPADSEITVDATGVVVYTFSQTVVEEV